MLINLAISYCIVFYSVPTGYNITYNATEYEFDVNVYSPIGKVVFEALIIVENINRFTIINVAFMGSDSNGHEYGPYSLNGMDDFISFDPPTTNPLLTITLDENLNSTDQDVKHDFMLNFFAIGVDNIVSESVNVTLHEVGRLMCYLCTYYIKNSWCIHMYL